MNPTTRNSTREVQIGRTTIGSGHPIAVQSMAATRTQDTEATTRQLRLLAEAGADVIRVAVDSKKDVEALAQIAPTVDVPLSVDLQENYRLVQPASRRTCRKFATTPGISTTTKRTSRSPTRSPLLPTRPPSTIAPCA